MKRLTFQITLDATTPITEHLKKEMEQALAEIVNQVLEENQADGVDAHMMIFGAGEAPIIEGAIDSDDLPAAVARMVQAAQGPRDAYGATPGCLCPRCVKIRSLIVLPAARLN